MRRQQPSLPNADLQMLTAVFLRGCGTAGFKYAVREPSTPGFRGTVIPAQAGIQITALDSRLRGYDEKLLL